VDTLTTGLTISLVGIGIVFGLLALLWGFVAVLMRIDAAPALPETPSGNENMETDKATALETTVLPPELVAALTIAVVSHRTLQRRQAAPAIRSHQPGAHLHASRWVAAGRTRQNRTWPAQRG